MNILFSHSYFLRFDPKQWKLGQPYAPLATLYAAAWLRAQGHSVSLFDPMFVSDPAAVSESIQEHRPEVFVVYDDGFNYLTKMCLTNMRDAALKMIAIAREHGCKVIVSSSDATDHCETYLRSGADFVLIGEAEQTLHELVGELRSPDFDPANIPGVAWLSDEGVKKSEPRQLLRDLDKIPFPAWDLVDVEAYRSTWLKSTGYFSLNMSTTRGCPFKCNWCAKPIYGNRYNSRSPQNVVDELVMLRQRYGFDHIWFCDDIFGLKPGWVQQFAVLVQSSGLKFRFKIQSRADLLLQDDTVQALKTAGCENVWIGAESGSQKILDAMDKGITVGQIREATATLKRHGIAPSLFIQFGYPGENAADIDNTLSMIRELLPQSIGVSVSYPLPGTVFFERVKAQLSAKANWTDSDELALMFTNTYQPSFYRQLHRYVQWYHRKNLTAAYLRNLLARPSSVSIASLRKFFAVFYYYLRTWLSGARLSLLTRKEAI